MTMSNTEKKFVIKKWMVITAIVVVAITTVCIILGFIPNTSLTKNEFADYMYVNVYDATNTEADRPLVTVQPKDDDNYYDVFNAGMQTTNFSVLRGLLEFKVSNSLKFTTEEVVTTEPVYDEDGYQEVDEDGEKVTQDITTTERIMIDPSTIKTDIVASEGVFVLEFVYANQTDERKSITIEGEEVLFDTMRIIINNSGNEIKDYPMYLYDSNEIHNTERGEVYEITPIMYRADLTGLYEALEEIQEMV